MNLTTIEEEEIAMLKCESREKKYIQNSKKKSIILILKDRKLEQFYITCYLQATKPLYWYQ